MPRLDGLQFLQKVQRHDSALLHSIIAFSGDDDAIHQAMHLGIRNILKKPFDLEVLLERVEQVMCQSEEKILV
jgi:DNA-binding NarL/FixJ family response regulator